MVTKLKLIPLLLTALMVLVVGCGGTAEPTPAIEAIIDTTVKEAIAALPTPTPEVVVKEVPVEKAVVVTGAPLPTYTPTATPNYYARVILY